MVAIVLLTLLFVQQSIAQATTDKLDSFLVKIPGSDFLGWGWNAQEKNPEFALTQSIFKYTYNGVNGSEFTYRYPTSPIDYAVPDQVTVRSISKTKTESFIYDSTSETIFSLDLSVGIGGTTPTFSGSITLALGIVFETDETKSIFRSLAETALWQMNLDTKILLPEVKAEIARLSQKNYDQLSLDYDNFFALYGTHYVDVVVLGGLGKMDTVIEGDTDAFRFKLGVILQGKMTGGMTIEGRIDFELGIATSSSASTLNSQSVVYGGDPYCAGWITKQNQPDLAKQLFSTWKNSLGSNPIVVRYRLVSMDTLFSGASKQDACKAIAKKLGSETFCSNSEVKSDISAF